MNFGQLLFSGLGLFFSKMKCLHQKTQSVPTGIIYVIVIISIVWKFIEKRIIIYFKLLTEDLNLMLKEKGSKWMSREGGGTMKL